MRVDSCLRHKELMKLQLAIIIGGAIVYTLDSQREYSHIRTVQYM